MTEASIAVGEQAPTFEAPDQHGTAWNLVQHLERGPVVLVFYRAIGDRTVTGNSCSMPESTANSNDETRRLPASVSIPSNGTRRW